MRSAIVQRPAQSKLNLSAMLFCLMGIMVLLQPNATAQTLRRPISPSQPLLMIHADVWNNADPQKVIDLIPQEIRPYVVLNLSLSINHNATTGVWLTSEYGYEIAKSWIRTAAENRIWATIQPSSGGFSHFPDYAANADLDTTIYGEFFRDYPNFLGINYAEQFWGFDDKWSLTWTERVNHWTALMRLTHKYGGYLTVSFTGGFWGAGLNSVAMVKRNPGFAAILKQYPQNFIMEEKFTMAYGFHDIESTSMGMWLSGYAGHYGIRFDECGWVGNNGEAFPVAAGAIPYLEHLMLTGQTVIDGPELIWQQSIKGLADATTADGFKSRRWEFYPQFKNITLDVFNKVLDGTIRILDRKEVIARTKIVIVNDATSGDDRVKYSSPETLFEGLYRMNSDGNYMSNLSWFKKTGRYPAIPVVYQLVDDTAKAFQVQVNRTSYATRWPTIAAKQAEFNNLFPSEYSGDIYAARHENGWVTYNPYKTGQRATGSIPFKYNTSERIDVDYALYSMGVIKETPSKINLYLTNYDNVNTGLKTDVVKIYGSKAQPTYSYTDRASHQASSITSSWSGGVFTLNVTHNGPLDITVNCAGSATGRLTSYKTATLASPSSPAIYTGPRQYEAENFDFKSISSNVANGTGKAIRNYQGLGYLLFGTNSAAKIRDTIRAQSSGKYKLETRYAIAGGNVGTIDLYVNGVKATTPVFVKTGSESTFAINTQTVSLNAGVNVILFQAVSAPAYNVVFDNIVITPVSSQSSSSSAISVSSSSSKPSSSSAVVSSSSAKPSSSSAYVTSSSSTKTACIAFVNGVGGYGSNCYYAGLANMTANTCYTMNPARGNAPLWINNSASDTWWWSVSSCAGLQAKKFTASPVLMTPSYYEVYDLQGRLVRQYHEYPRQLSKGYWTVITRNSQGQVLKTETLTTP